MSTLIWVFLLSVVVLLPFKAAFLYWVFRDDIRQYLAERRVPARRKPVCLYCQSESVRPVEDGVTRWEGESLVLVTTFECLHCQLPFWNVERVPVAAGGRPGGRQ